MMHATGTMTQYSHTPCPSVLGLILDSRVRDVRCTECRSSLGWAKERMMAVSKEETKEIEFLLTFVVCLPCPDERARNGLDPRHSRAPHCLPTRSTLRAGLWTERRSMLACLDEVGRGGLTDMQHVCYVPVTVGEVAQPRWQGPLCPK